ncbi:MAG: hypothetical protein KA104_01630 [Candidatus Pacebacteria bacterium]|nr:hypothetical protein [Candidatus Paceibacterota bacterium]
MISFLEKLFTSIVIGVSGFFGIHAEVPAMVPPATTNSSQESVSESAATSAQNTVTPTVAQSGWKNIALAGLTIEYPSSLKVIHNTDTPSAQLRFVESANNRHARVFVSAANIIPANQDLKSWLESFDYFKAQYRAQKYISYKRKDGVEVFASLGNTQSYDDAFMRSGAAVVYVKNGVNEYTKVSDSDFREIIERIKLPNGLKLGTVAGGYGCITGSNELMTLYWGTQYRKVNPSVPFIYASGSYCESANGSKLMTMAYFLQGTGSGNEQAIVSFDSTGKITNTYKGSICHTVGDFGSPLISSVEQGRINMFCLSGDGGYTAFEVFQAPLDTLVPVAVKRDSAVYNSVKAIVEKIYNIDFSTRNLF